MIALFSFFHEPHSPPSGARAPQARLGQPQLRVHHQREADVVRAGAFAFGTLFCFTCSLVSPWQWLTGYLCYQIEHHMFPSIPHPNLPLVAPRVKKLLERHNMVYDCRSMTDAFTETMTNLYVVGNAQS